MGILDRLRGVGLTHAAPQVAAAVRQVNTGNLPQGLTYSRSAGEAWTVYRSLGEVGYVTNQQSRLVGRLDWTITLPGQTEPLDTEKSDELMRAAFGDDVEDLATKASLNLQVAGGYYLARTRPGDPTSWKVYASPLSAKAKKKVEASDVAIEVRIEDPADEDRNDSPVLRALDTCRDLMLVRAQSRAQSRNRTAQHGLVLFPSEGTKDPIAFAAELQDIITAPLADERDPSSVTPNIVGFPAEYIEKWDKIDLGGDYDEKLDAKDERLVRSLAVQLDAPPELVLGFADANHWSTWAIQEDNWSGHVQPMAKPVGQGFAAAIRAVTDVDLKVEPDPGPLMVRRPTVTDALAAYEQDLVSADWTREQLGADETDAPTPEELNAKRAARALPPAPASQEPPAPEDSAPTGPRAVAAALRGVLPSRPVVPDAPTPTPVAAAPVRRGPDPMALAAIDTQVHDAVEDLINDTADRCMERLGAKVRSMSRGIDLPADVPNARLAVEYAGPIPNADAAITDTIMQATDRLQRAVSRAYARTRSLGLDVHLQSDDEANAHALFLSLTQAVVAARLEDRPTTAAAWQAARRVCAVAGGNPDPANLERAS